MHQESWVGMAMLGEQKRNDLIREANQRRLVNCCKNRKSLFSKIVFPAPKPQSIAADCSRIMATDEIKL